MQNEKEVQCGGARLSRTRSWRCIIVVATDLRTPRVVAQRRCFSRYGREDTDEKIRTAPPPWRAPLATLVAATAAPTVLPQQTADVHTACVLPSSCGQQLFKQIVQLFRALATLGQNTCARARVIQSFKHGACKAHPCKAWCAQSTPMSAHAPPRLASPFLLFSSSIS